MSLIQLFYGDNKQHRFNADCKVCILLEYVRRKTEYYEYDNIDIADKNTGAVLKLFMPDKQQELATKFIPPNTPLVLVKYDVDASGNPTAYTALFKDENGNTPTVSENAAPAKPAGKKK
jgi:hypothetical protein